MKLRLICTEGTRKSSSLKELAKNLQQKVGYKVWRSLIAKPNRRNLNYGQSSNKLQQYLWFQQQGLSALEFTTNAQEADAWLDAGDTVFGRKLLNGSCGKGIVVFEPEGTKPSQNPCPVYTKYKKKKREFRVHIFQNKVVAVVEKRKRSGYEGPSDTKIRNLANGYVFCQTVENEPTGLRQLALNAAGCVQSDFKGVDIGYNEKKNDLFVIEVNSAPGIQGSNVNAYVQAILSA